MVCFDPFFLPKFLSLSHKFPPGECMSEDTLMCSDKGATAKPDVILIRNDSCLYVEDLLGPPRETSLSRK